MTFSSIYGSFLCTTMPMGTNFSPETFCKLADKIIDPIRDLSISSYIDNFCIPAVSQMLYELCKLFEQFCAYWLTLNPTKSCFLMPQVEYIGRLNDSNGTRPIQTNIQKIIGFSGPKQQKKREAFSDW